MVRTRIWQSLATLTCLVLVSSQASAANLLANPAFEFPVTTDGAPFVGSWEAFAGGGASSNNSTTSPLSGLRSLRTSILNTDNSFAGVSQDVLGQVPGQPALWRVWLMTPSNPLDVGVFLRIEWRDTVADVEVSLTENLYVVPGFNQYTQASLFATVPPGANSARVTFTIETFSGGPTNSGIVFVDDASFDNVPEPTSVAMWALGAIGVSSLRRR
jgi:hypothetical protein